MVRLWLTRTADPAIVVFMKAFLAYLFGMSVGLTVGLVVAASDPAVRGFVQAKIRSLDHLAQVER